MSQWLTRWIVRVAAVVYVVGALAVTVGPEPPERLNIVGNILLTAPLGGLVAMRSPRLHPSLVVLAGFTIGCTIEVAQLLILANRYSSLNDIALNTSGAGLGWIAGRTIIDLVGWVVRRPPDPPPGP